jgi:DNA-binding transcriptional LysR family regulator
MLNGQDFKYFVEAANALNLSRAAERLGITQPSLSLAIQRIENEMGVKIFHRNKKGVTLSPQGLLLLTESRLILQNWEGIKGKIRKSGSEVTGYVNIGCHPSVALYTLPGLLPDILQKYKNLEIKLTHDLSRKICEQVIRSQIDIGIVVNPIKHPDLVIENLCFDEVTFWESKNSKNRDVLICEPDLGQTKVLLSKLKKLGVEIKRQIYSSNLEVITELTRAGSGIGILPTRVAHNLHKDLVKIKNTPKVIDEISVVYRSENRGIASVKEIVRRLSASVFSEVK